MFSAALFARAKTWKQPQGPSTDRWMRTLWRTHNGVSRSHKDKWNLAICNNTMDFKGIMLSEINQTNTAWPRLHVKSENNSNDPNKPSKLLATENSLEVDKGHLQQNESGSHGSSLTHRSLRPAGERGFLPSDPETSLWPSHSAWPLPAANKNRHSFPQLLLKPRESWPSLCLLDWPMVYHSLLVRYCNSSAIPE